MNPAQLELGSVLLDESLARVKEHNQLFVNAAFTAICARATQPGPFTSDDIWPHVYADSLVEPRAMGAAFREAQSTGIIRSTGQFTRSKRAACHRRPVQIWESNHSPPSGETATERTR